MGAYVSNQLKAREVHKYQKSCSAVACNVSSDHKKVSLVLFLFWALVFYIPRLYVILIFHFFFENYKSIIHT